MLVKSQVKYIQSLGHKKFRDADAVFVAEGPKSVEEILLSHNATLVSGFALSDWLSAHESLIRGNEKKWTEVSGSELERLSFQTNPSEVLAVFTKPIFKKRAMANGITILLDTIQDPGNLGTIVRTADWYGVHTIICSPGTADVFNPKVIQAAMGSMVRVEVIYTDLIEYIQANADTPLFASSLEGEDLQEKIRVPKLLLLMGNESKGISAGLELLAKKKIRIPKKGNAESLNVAVATGILLSSIELLGE